MHLAHGVLHRSKVQVMREMANSALSSSHKRCSLNLSFVGRSATAPYRSLRILPSVRGHETRRELAEPRVF